MYRVFEHSQVVLSSFQCIYVIYEASLQSHELYYDDPVHTYSSTFHYSREGERVNFFSRTTPFLHRTILHRSFVVFIPEEKNPSRTSIIVFRNFRNAIKVQSSPKTCFPTLSISDFYSLAVYLNEKLSYTTPFLPSFPR